MKNNDDIKFKNRTNKVATKTYERINTVVEEFLNSKDLSKEMDYKKVMSIVYSMRYQLDCLAVYLDSQKVFNINENFKNFLNEKEPGIEMYFNDLEDSTQKLLKYIAIEEAEKCPSSQKNH